MLPLIIETSKRFSFMEKKQKKNKKSYILFAYKNSQANEK